MQSASRRRQSPTMANTSSSVIEPDNGIGKSPAATAREVHGALLEALLKRDVMHTVASSLLVGKSPDELARVQDYIDYWDSIQTEKHPGLLVSLIQRGDALPASFQTRRQREQRLAAEACRRNQRRVDDTLALAYENHRRAVIDAFITANITPEQLAQRVQTEKDQMLQAEIWATMNPEMLESLAQRLVEEAIAKEVPIISFDAFRRQELPRVIADLQLDPAGYAIEGSSVRPSSEIDMPQNAPESLI